MSRRPPRVPPTPRRTLFVLPEVRDDWPVALKDSIAVRNAASVSGVCPVCGARAEVVPDPDVVGLWHAWFAHEPECPALTGDEVAA